MGEKMESKFGIDEVVYDRGFDGKYRPVTVEGVYCSKDSYEETVEYTLLEYGVGFMVKEEYLKTKEELEAEGLAYETK